MLAQRISETGDWFVRRIDFTQWMSETGKTLICQGPPGVGKSVLAAIAVDHLHSSISSEDRVLAYYCDHSDDTTDKRQKLLGALLQQLIVNDSTVKHAIEELHKNHQRGTRPKPHELIAILRDEIATAHRVYVVLDALDEWSSDPADISLLLSDMTSLGSNVNLLITSRPIALGEGVSIVATMMNIDMPRSDLEIYIKARLARDSQRGILKRYQCLQSTAVDTVLSSCEGL